MHELLSSFFSWYLLNCEYFWERLFSSHFVLLVILINVMLCCMTFHRISPKSSFLSANHSVVLSQFPYYFSILEWQYRESLEDTPLSLLPENEAVCESLMAILLFFLFLSQLKWGEYWSSRFLSFWLIMRISNVRYTGCLVYWRNLKVYCEFITVSNITLLFKILTLITNFKEKIFIMCEEMWIPNM